MGLAQQVFGAMLINEMSTVQIGKEADTHEALDDYLWRYRRHRDAECLLCAIATLRLT